MTDREPIGSFDGRVAIVTGAGSGIGRETALLFAARGAQVLCVDIEAERVARVVDEITAAGGDTAGEVCDVADADACGRVVTSALDRFGRIDVVANVAGIAMMRRFAAVDAELWDRILAVNLTGPFNLCHAALDPLVESEGNIVNVASQAGLRGYSHLSAYSASKGGLVMLTRSLAVELAPLNVRVNCVCPGAVLTNIGDSIGEGEDIPEEVAMSMMQRNPQLSPPIDLARAIVFLASAEAASITGAVLPVDGGSTA